MEWSYQFQKVHFFLEMGKDSVNVKILFEIKQVCVQLDIDKWNWNFHFKFLTLIWNVYLGNQHKKELIFLLLQTCFLSVKKNITKDLLWNLEYPINDIIIVITAVQVFTMLTILSIHSFSWIEEKGWKNVLFPFLLS